eukprot:1158659-Pelagomonas_calceolata.AAC.6
MIASGLLHTGGGLPTQSLYHDCGLLHTGGGLSAQSLYHDPDHGVLSQLRKVRAWFEAQRSMQFFQASLLFTYEGTARSAAEANVQVYI